MKKKQNDKITDYGIMESLKDASIMLGHEMSRRDVKEVFDSIKGKSLFYNEGLVNNIM